VPVLGSPVRTLSNMVVGMDAAADQSAAWELPPASVRVISP